MRSFSEECEEFPDCVTDVTVVLKTDEDPYVWRKFTNGSRFSQSSHRKVSENESHRQEFMVLSPILITELCGVTIAFRWFIHPMVVTTVK